MYRVVELIGSSSDTGEDAARNAVREAASTYQDLRAEVVEMDVLIEDGENPRVPDEGATQRQAGRRLIDDRNRGRGTASEVADPNANSDES